MCPNLIKNNYTFFVAMGKSIFIANNGKFLGLIRIILKCDEKMFSIKKGKRRNCPGVHWLRICLLIQRTWV